MQKVAPVLDSDLKILHVAKYTESIKEAVHIKSAYNVKKVTFKKLKGESCEAALLDLNTVTVKYLHKFFFVIYLLVS